MDIWSAFCPNISSNNDESTESQSSTSSASPEGKLSAAHRRLTFSVANKLSRSFPSASQEIVGSTAEFFTHFSLEDVAMQNNCTVISNKVGPVVIKNCKEEYQMRQGDRNCTGRLHEQSAEHELLLNRFFLLKDQFVGVDRHDTLGEYGVPNLRVLEGLPAIYAVGQPTTNGLQKFTASILKKHNHIYYINVRAVPTLFLRRSDDFLPYSAYSAGQGSQANMYETERNLHDAEREIQLQALRIAASNGGMFYYYNVLDSSPNEPHMYTTNKMEDLVTSRQMYAKILSENKNFKYTRLVLPCVEKPSVEWLDSFIDIIREIQVAGDKDAAIVFQGLTGEGPATLAAVIAHLTLRFSSAISETVENNCALIRTVESELKWREYVIQNILKASDLDGDKLRNEVNLAIASSCTTEILGAISNTSLDLKTPWRFLGTDATAITSTIVEKTSQKSKCSRTASSGSITLRDMSELSLQATGSPREHRGNQLIRYEVCDEERLLKMLLFNTDLYHYILVFRAYSLEQGPLSFQKPFSRWLVHIPDLVFDLTQASAVLENTDGEIKCQLTEHTTHTCDIALDPTFHRIVGIPIFGIGQTTPKRFEKLVLNLCSPHSRKRYKKVHFINAREEPCFYSCSNNIEVEITQSMNEENNDHERLWELQPDTIPYMHGARTHMIEEVEERFKHAVDSFHMPVEFISGIIDAGETAQGPLKTTKEVMTEMNETSSLKEICDGISYTRIPVPRYRIPRFQCFDRLIEVIRGSSQENNDTAYVFFCHNGKKRSTNMMVASCLIMTHMKIFELDIENSSTITEPWAPDVEFTRGEYKVVQELIQILPDCHLRKGEVDAALDLCHEGMSTMHYHLRENLNPSYKKAKKAKDIVEFLTLKHRAYLGLELYVFLILFNCYLHEHKGDLWRSLTFNDWMSQHATRLGVIEILNNFGFMTFGEDYPMNMLRSRWMDTKTLVRNIQVGATNLIGYRQSLKSNSSLETCLEQSSP